MEKIFFLLIYIFLCLEHSSKTKKDYTFILKNDFIKVYKNYKYLKGTVWKVFYPWNHHHTQNAECTSHAQTFPHPTW